MAFSSLPATGQQFLTGHVTHAITESKVLGPVERSTRLNLAVGLPLQHQDELDSLLAQLMDPASPGFQHYLTPEQFALRFGPPEGDYQKLADYFTAHGLEVTATSSNRMILDVAGAVPDIENALHVNLIRWQHPSRGTFFAPDREPLLDIDVPVLHIGGLDNYVLPRPMDLKWRPLTATPETSGSGPVGLFIGGDFRAAYAPGVTLSGSGQSVGLFELDGFYASDVAANFQTAGLTPVPVKTVLLDGFNGSPGSGNTEVTLDIMMAAYMAPGLSSVIVYEGTNWDDVLNRMATDNLAKQLSSSWCFYPTDATTEQIFQQMIAQGQSLFQASGDSGAYGGWIMPPADDPNVTVTGGTSLTTASAGGAWKSEAAWSGSGGGASTVWPIPSYQKPVNVAGAGGSTTRRNIPDVAMVADVQMFLIQNNGQAIEVGGTSAAAPLWAGFLALANQQAAAQGKPTVGFLNPLIYTIGQSSGYAADFHDITSGNNGGFLSLTGYDLTTGWGSPNGQSLINALSGVSGSPTFSLAVSPATLSIAQGASGGVTVNITPQNGFSQPVTLAVSGLPSGVTAAFSPSPATTSSRLTLSAAGTASLGTATITITATCGKIVETARLTLTVTGVPSFTLSAAPANLSLQQGATVTSTISITPQNGFNSAVTLAASGLPKGVSAAFSAITSSGISTLTLTAASSATVGAATVTITGTSGTLHPIATFALSVIAAVPNFSLKPAASSVSVTQGGSATNTITISPVNQFSGTVALSATGLPLGVTAKFNPASTTTSSTVTFTASATAVAGTVNVVVTGTSGSLSNQATISLTIAVPQNFTLTAAPPSVGLVPGASGASTIIVSGTGGFAGNVALVTSGLPSGVTAAFSPASTASTSVLTLSASKTAASGSSTVTITGTSGSLSARLTITVTVAPFSLSGSPAALIVAPGASGATQVTVTPQSGFTGTVALSVSGLPAGISGAFSSGSKSTISVLTFSANANAAPGLTQVVVTGKSGSYTQTTTVALTVAQPPAENTAVNMAQWFNIPAMVTDNSTFATGGLDGGGRAYSANLLGTSQTVNGIPFNLGPANGLGAATSITIDLPADQFTTLTMLATAVNGTQTAQPFVVTYSDGTTSAYTQSLSDWCLPQNYAGESKGVNMTYRDNSVGTRDTRTILLYEYSFSLSNAKTIRSLTLPPNRNVVVLAINLSTAVEVNLASVFDTTGIVTDGQKFTTGLDGVGYAYSANLLGVTQTFHQAAFSLGPANSPDVVSGSGKNVTLPAGQFSSLQLLASGVNGNQPSQTIKIQYSDGTAAAFSQSLSDWFTPQSYPGESVALTLPYRDTAAGIADNRQFHLYGYSFALNNAKTVSSIVLPANTNVKVLAITLIP